MQNSCNNVNECKIKALRLPLGGAHWLKLGDRWNAHSLHLQHYGLSLVLTITKDYKYLKNKKK